MYDTRVAKIERLIENLCFTEGEEIINNVCGIYPNGLCCYREFEVSSKIYNSMLDIINSYKQKPNIQGMTCISLNFNKWFSLTVKRENYKSVYKIRVV